MLAWHRQRVIAKEKAILRGLKKNRSSARFCLHSGGGGVTLASMSSGDILTTKQAAALLGLSEQMVRRLARRKNFRVLRRNPLLISKPVLEAFVRRRDAYAAAKDGLDRWMQNEPEYMI